MDEARVRCLAAEGESLTVEFKSDIRRQVNDRTIYENVVCFANSEGGVLLIGVEDDGRITGARFRHDGATSPARLQAAIFNNTEPHVNTRVSVFILTEGHVIAIEVDPFPEVCMTGAGVCLHRVMTTDGPSCQPYFPHQQLGRRITLGLHDLTSQPCPDATFQSLDPLQFERARQVIERFRGDRTLLELDNEEMAKALGLVESTDTGLVPTMAGMLLMGRQSALQSHLPTHEVAFQVLDEAADVKVNDFFRTSLLEALDEVQRRFDARLEEEEVLVGMFRLAVPEYGRTAFREALLNALFHRDYSALGTVYVQWHPDHLFISNPGSFPHGITVENLLTHEPRPRNPRLYQAAKRLGLVEQTGRGIDKIYADQIRLGRPAPSYERSDADAVRVVLRGGKANLAFARLVAEQEQEGPPLKVEDLLILNHLEHERRIDVVTAAALVQRPQSEARSCVERLLERGLLEARGERRGRVYHLSALVYRALGQPESYVRVHGITRQRQEAMVVEFLKAHGRVERKHVAELCGITGPQAGRLLKKMMNDGTLERRGSPPRWTYYVLARD